MSFDDYYGLDLLWFIGVVESRYDPLKIGRCKVRCLGFHTENLENLKTEDLPWSHLLIPPNSDYEVKPPKEGSWVIGFFKDGKECQEPMILSLVPGIPIIPAEDGKDEFLSKKCSVGEESKQRACGFYDLGSDLNTRPRPPEDLISNDGSPVVIKNPEKVGLYPEGKKDGEDLPFMKHLADEPDTSRVARNEEKESTLIQKRIDWLQKNIPMALKKSETWQEPKTEYNSIYPYNNVKQTESGHMFEVDDTRGKERISQQHRSGTFYEIHPDGTKVEKVLNKNFKIVHGNEYVLNFDGLEICIKGSKGELIEGDYNIEVKGNVDIESSRIDLNKHLD